MSQFKEQKYEELLKQLAAEFLLHESNGSSLVTVTGVSVTDKQTKATILFTVFPTSKEEEALDFAKRKRPEFKEYIKEHAQLRKIPFVDFEIDIGEKNRQRIDELSQ